MREDIRYKNERYLRRKRRVRARVFGTAARPRLVVSRSIRSTSCQLIDDEAGQTLAAVTEREAKATGSKSLRAAAVGRAIAEKAKGLNITSVVFDRNGRLYHGRVRALAEAARAAGLAF